MSVAAPSSFSHVSDKNKKLMFLSEISWFIAKLLLVRDLTLSRAAVVGNKGLVFV